MDSPIRLAMNGASGRMGRAVLDLARADRRFAVRAALVGDGSGLIGQSVFPMDPQEKLTFGTSWGESGQLDVVVDFSTPVGLSKAIDYCTAHHVPLVTGTTGVGVELDERLRDAAQSIPVLRAANFSLGVAVLTRLLREAAAALPDWDLDIVEAHHGRKEDAPSGTALALGEAAASGRGITLAESAVYTREGRTGPREHGTIGFAVVRGGDIVGEHLALLMGRGERVELAHRATDRSIFARGALESAHWLAGCPAGSYDLEAMLAERAVR